MQTDNPFVNAGIFYVQHATRDDAAGWLLDELNRRIERFTYRPESVKELPHSGWSTPPHFANADEQANLNDIVASALNGKHTYANGVEFYEARFKKDKGSKEAKAKMSDGAWVHATQQGDVGPARRALTSLRPEHKYDPIVHLCKMDLFRQASVAPLRVPGNATAKRAELLLAPEWLFSHFPYGAFFPSFQQCHADRWKWAEASKLEQRLCMPRFRVPVIMVHMAGLRNGQWGRRGVMRALGVWNELSDTVAPEAWVSRRENGLLLADSLPRRFGSMAEFDRFAARLLLLGLLLRRRVVMPPMPCGLGWVKGSLEPRHLRGLEVGCGADKQCVWLPMPHFKEAWCSGVDFLYDIDYRERVASGNLTAADVSPLPLSDLSLAGGDLPTSAAAGSLLKRRGGGALPASRVLALGGEGQTEASLLDWLPLEGFKNKAWRGPLPQAVKAALQPAGGGGLSDSQLGIVKDCLQSLATSRD